ncbi:MAG: hypothetical protein HC773_26195 [Scytonema sp. CRU_2_7]|nr:hypothetical protein [Scytonema sp. CRU_2_7]
MGGTGKFDVKIYERFAEKVGWKKRDDNWYGYEELKFDPRGTAGHLPVYFNLPYWLWKQASNRVEWDKHSAVAAFFSRVSFCER